jgi:hypothetical protein
MYEKILKWGFAIGGIAVAAFLVFATGIKVGEQNNCYAYAERHVAFFCYAKGSVLGALGSISNLISENRDVIEAVSTIAIALFTGTLWWSTRRLWRATKEAAEHIPLIERPYIYAFGVHKLITDRTVVGGFTPFIKYTVANYGKTPAVIEMVEAGMIVLNEIPIVPPHRDNFIHWLVRNPVMEPAERRANTKVELPDGVTFTNPSEQEFCPTLAEGHRLFFRLVIKYRGPFAGGYETSACWELDPDNNRFRETGGAKYNYAK